MLSNIKIVTINLEYLHHLSFMLEIANNIEELNLSVTYFGDTYRLKVPKSITKLHFEYTGKFSQIYAQNPLTLQIIQPFFDNLKNQLNSLTSKYCQSLMVNSDLL
jgi:hypothetical protein